MYLAKLVSRISIATIVTVGASLLVTATESSAATVYNFSGDFGPAFTANVTLDVVGGQALSGTGTINFAGSNSFDLTLITLGTLGGNYGGTTGFRDNHGTDIFGGSTAVPIDSNGLIFAISKNPVWGQNALFAAWDNGDNNFQFLISGALEGAFDVYYKITDGSAEPSLSDVTATPLPAALPLFATGLAGMGLLGWRRSGRLLSQRPNCSIVL